MIPSFRVTTGGVYGCFLHSRETHMFYYLYQGNLPAAWVDDGPARGMPNEFAALYVLREGNSIVRGAG